VAKKDDVALFPRVEILHGDRRAERWLEACFYVFCSITESDDLGFAKIKSIRAATDVLVINKVLIFTDSEVAGINLSSPVLSIFSRAYANEIASV
jgi:hypothetical protein